MESLELNIPSILTVMLYSSMKDYWVVSYTDKENS